MLRIDTNCCEKIWQIGKPALLLTGVVLLGVPLVAHTIGLSILLTTASATKIAGCASLALLSIRVIYERGRRKNQETVDLSTFDAVMQEAKKNDDIEPSTDRRLSSRSLIETRVKYFYQLLRFFNTIPETDERAKPLREQLIDCKITLFEDIGYHCDKLFESFKNLPELRGTIFNYIINDHIFSFLPLWKENWEEVRKLYSSTQVSDDDATLVDTIRENYEKYIKSTLISRISWRAEEQQNKALLQRQINIFLASVPVHLRG